MKRNRVKPILEKRAATTQSVAHHAAQEDETEEVVEQTPVKSWLKPESPLPTKSRELRNRLRNN
jgi:hypothetical protein